MTRVSYTWQAVSISEYGIGTFHTFADSIDEARASGMDFLVQAFVRIFGNDSHKLAEFRKAAARDLAREPVIKSASPSNHEETPF